MSRSLALAILLSLSTPLLAGSSASVRIQMTVVTPRVVVEPEAPTPPAVRPARAPVRRDLRRRRARLLTVSHHGPRPLSPGEFGRARHGL